MSRIHVACVGYSGQLVRYWRGLSAAELPPNATSTSARSQLRWRRQSPATARFVPHVAPEVIAAGFRGEAAEAAWKRTVEAARRLEADTVILHTPSTFRPTGTNRALLTEFFGAHRPADLRVAWRADGLWESQPEDRDETCVRAGLIPVIDPLALEKDEEPAPGPFVYWRLLGRPGSSTRLSDFDLDTLLAFAEERTGGYIVFGAGWMMGDARRFATMLGTDEGEGEADEEDEDDEEDGEDEDDDDAIGQPFPGGDDDDDDLEDDDDGDDGETAPDDDE